MSVTTIKGRTIMKGDVQAEAIVTRTPLSFSYIDDAAAVLDSTHDLYGQIIKDKILVIPTLKGSAMQELALAALVQSGRAPKGIVASEADSRLIAAALFCEIPTMDRLEKNPLEVINTGDLVRINADNGIVEVRKPT